MQVAALSAALAGAMLLTWTERRWPEVQEAIIGVVFVLASSVAILLLAENPHGGEHLKELLVGQILWVNPARLPLGALIYAAILALWFGLGERLGRIGFYRAVRLRGDRVGAAGRACIWSSSRWSCRRSRPTTPATARYLKAYAVGVLGYAVGLLASLVARSAFRSDDRLRHGPHRHVRGLARPQASDPLGESVSRARK